MNRELARDVRYLECATSCAEICAWARRVELGALRALGIQGSVENEHLDHLRREAERVYYEAGDAFEKFLPKVKAFDVAVYAHRVARSISFEDLQARVHALDSQLKHRAAPRLDIEPRVRATRQTYDSHGGVYEETI